MKKALYSLKFAPAWQTQQVSRAGAFTAAPVGGVAEALAALDLVDPRVPAFGVHGAAGTWLLDWFLITNALDELAEVSTVLPFRVISPAP